MFMSVRMLSRQVGLPYMAVRRAVDALRLEPRRERGVLLLDCNDQLAVCEYLAARAAIKERR